ncbi:MAG: hypothetical protein ACYSYU_07905 [Planctomycetota bacterium]|jgi:hypothetical protein
MATVYTDAGEAGVVDLIDGTSATVLSNSNAKIAWGSGGGTAAKGDTTLFTEESEARVVPTVSQPSADINQWVGTLTADGAKTITNAGLFDAAAAGTLYVKGDFTGIVLALNDKIEFTISLEQT